MLLCRRRVIEFLVPLGVSRFQQSADTSRACAFVASRVKVRGTRKDPVESSRRRRPGYRGAPGLKHRGPVFSVRVGGLTIHSSRARFAASAKTGSPRAGRLNSGVRPQGERMHKFPKILQIMPAKDWVADYDDSSENAEPILCFALVEVTSDGETFHEVRAMVPDGKLISFADEASNFSGVRHAIAANPA